MFLGPGGAGGQAFDQAR
nr:RecName: Full=Uncharacterized protein IMPP18 [Nautilus macromphalus]